jgi:hypothetical protein
MAALELPSQYVCYFVQNNFSRVSHHLINHYEIKLLFILILTQVEKQNTFKGILKSDAILLILLVIFCRVSS